MRPGEKHITQMVTKHAMRKGFEGTLSNSTHREIEQIMNKNRLTLMIQ